MSLALKGVNITTGCKVCGIDENDLHVLLYCPVAIGCWKILDFLILDQHVPNRYILIQVKLNLSNISLQRKDV